MGRLIPILFLLMSLAVATREIPELYSLADDPSNDAQILNSQARTSPHSIRRVENKEIFLAARTIIFTPIQNLNRRSVILVSTGQDILCLLRCLRT